MLNNIYKQNDYFVHFQQKTEIIHLVNASVDRKLSASAIFTLILLCFHIIFTSFSPGVVARGNIAQNTATFWWHFGSYSVNISFLRQQKHLYLPRRTMLVNKHGLEIVCLDVCLHGTGKVRMDKIGNWILS